MEGTEGVFVEYYANFLHDFCRLPKVIQRRAVERETIFKQNPFDTRLHTHKLHGSMKQFWSFRVDYQYRIVFEFAKNNVVRYYRIGTHDIYD